MKKFVNLILILLNICLTMVCCQQIQTAAKKENTITPPRSEEPAPPPTELNEWSNSFGVEHEAEEAILFNIVETRPSLPPPNETYGTIVENEFNDPLKAPYSTFSIDVDQASYSNVRRFLMSGYLPPTNAVRIEEMINYFNYDYPQPREEVPFTISTEGAQCPWNPAHQLVHVGIQGRNIIKENLPPNNLVFLLDVSGSMNEANKLPLLKNAFKMLVKELRPQDRVAIVVYAGASGLVLPPTSGAHKKSILLALEQLESGGGTAGAAGIQLAYKVARHHFIKGGNNRVILATDGDFNLGTRSDQALVHLIEQKRKQGVSLSVLGFGTGNYQDEKMEKLADNGDGNYAYIDNITEARKVLVNEFSSTLFTIAKDVKLQVEFNPSKVKGYRLVGYENRLLQDEDFNNDQKDAGELGAGHSVTALYEIIPAGSNEALTQAVDPLKYQRAAKIDLPATNSDEVLNVKIRYKKPTGQTSKKIEQAMTYFHPKLSDSSNNFRFSAAVASFGMRLRNSKFSTQITYPQITAMARAARGDDLFGYRNEFLRLIELAESYSEEVSWNE